jgi:hypothetical protein
MRNLYILQKEKSRRNWRPVVQLIVNGLSIIGMILSGIFTVAACSYDGPPWRVPLFMLVGAALFMAFMFIEAITNDEREVEEE